MVTEEQIKAMKRGERIITFAGEISNDTILFVLGKESEYDYKGKFVTTKNREWYDSKFEITITKI